MRAKNCHKCGKRFTAKLRNCPYCQTPGTQDAGLIRWLTGGAIGLSTLVFVVFIGATLWALVSGSNNNSDDNITTVKPSIKPKPEHQPHPAQKPITADDLIAYTMTDPYREQMVVMLNRLRARHPTCKKKLDPLMSGISTTDGTTDNPVFFVFCGTGDIKEKVTFSLSDIDSDAIPAPAQAIPKSKATTICRREARSRVNIPGSLDFSIIMDSAYTAKPNGNAIYSSTFTAKNAFGVKEKFYIYCYFNGRQDLTGVSIKPYLD